MSRSHNMVDYQSAKFVWETISQTDADQIRYILKYIRLNLFESKYLSKNIFSCVASNSSAAGVSNYASLIVKRPPVPVRAPEVETAGPTYLVVRLNVDRNDPTTYTGDGPITKVQDFLFVELRNIHVILILILK